MQFVVRAGVPGVWRITLPIELDLARGGGGDQDAGCGFLCSKRLAASVGGRNIHVAQFPHYGGPIGMDSHFVTQLREVTQKFSHKDFSAAHLKHDPHTPGEEANGQN